MYIEGTGSYTFKECHKTESLLNHTATAHMERERLGDRRNAGESSCNSGDGTGQMAQPLMFMMMMMLCMFRSLYSVYCLCVNVSCTAATECQPSCG
jgi:hypothetical protein